MVSPSRYAKEVYKDIDIYLRTNRTLIHYYLNPLYYPLIILPPQPPDSPLCIPRATQPLNGNPLPQVHLTYNTI